VDVHPVTFDAEGGGVYQDGSGEWVYPAQGFSGRGSVDGKPVRCLSPEVQVLVHAGYELTEKDYRELYLLRERFGIEPPEDLLERVGGRRPRCLGSGAGASRPSRSRPRARRPS
jgi:Aminoglycoside-2''-adenylyltransferase